jgi:hypothetical protein
MSKTTDQMIRDLLTHGFTLPEWLSWHNDGYAEGWFMPSANRWVSNSDIVHSTVAMHFAAEQSNMSTEEFDFFDRQWDEFQNLMGRGLAADAIKLLWEAANE